MTIELPIMTRKNCVNCGQPVYWASARESEDLTEITDRVDQHGVESLTESEQLAYEGRVCYDCLESVGWKERLEQ